MDHQLQLVIYAWLYEMRKGPDEMSHDFKIFNIRTGEIQKLMVDRENLDFIVVSLLQGKYERAEKINDEEFINRGVNVFMREG